MKSSYELVIVGGGPAGMTAGIYSARARIDAVLLERAMCGGQVLITDMVENYPGFPDGIKGPDLAGWMCEQASRAGMAKETAEVCGLKVRDGNPKTFLVDLGGGRAIEARSIIIATGAKWNSLGIPGEKELTGKGVSYCATCDGPLFKGREVIVVGGGDSALEDAIFLTKFAKKVTVIHRRDRLRAAKILQERASANSKIEFRLNSVPLEMAGSSKVEALKIKDVNTAKEDTIECSGIFVLIGMKPNSEMVKGIVETDEKGYIVSDENMRTSTDGVFVCGDVRSKSLRQIVTAVGEGAQAAFSAQHYIERIKGAEYI